MIFGSRSSRALRLVSLLLSFLALGSMCLRLRAFGASLELKDRERLREYAAAVELFLELGSPGDWSVAGGYLYKGKLRLADRESLGARSSAALPPDLEVRFGTGNGPSEGAVLAVGTKGGIGWIEVEPGPEALAMESERLLLIAVLGLAGILFAAVPAVAGVGRGEDRTGSRAWRAAESDTLTGLMSRRGIEKTVADLVRNHGLSHVAILGLDRFSAVNEDRGRDEGDRALAAVAEALVSTVRAADLCGRWGDDQFVIVYRGLAEEYAGASAERIRSALARRSLGPASAPFHLTATIGIAPLGQGGLPAAVLAVEAAMREGKLAGGDRVVVVPQD